MKFNIRNWITPLVSLWMCFTVTLIEAVNHVPNPLEVPEHSKNSKGKRWAILVAGSNGYENYRHQADVCHAYQVLKKGGLKDENIIVFMYDDIAHHHLNPRVGALINKPDGPDVYKGVPKDYTGNATTAKNFYAVISGNRSALSGGSGKVVDSGPNDTIFIYYADHGATGFIGMPEGEYVLANDFVNVLKEKHAAKSYKKMVIYMEACESGSMFKGILPHDINIYVITASDVSENSYAFYCPDLYPSPPSEYTTCLGDSFSISWLEDSDKNDMTKETLQQQYEAVRRRALASNINVTSHVMQYGDKKLKNDSLATYIGASSGVSNIEYSFESSTTQTRHISQRDAHLLHLRLELQKAPDGSEKKLKVQKQLDGEIAHRKHVDKVIHLIGELLFGKNSSVIMFYVRPPSQPVVDDWDCFKTFIKTYESQCGTFSSYGRKYTIVFASMCNAGISEEQLKTVLSLACPNKKHTS